MKIYLDDERDTPSGWMRTRTVDETIQKLQLRSVTELSLDNDLGEGQPEGYKVLSWLEETVYNDQNFPIPSIVVHSSNASRVEDMKRATKSIQKIRQDQLNKTKKMILDGIEAAKKQHFTVIDEDWGDTGLHCACALGCLLVANNVDDLDNANECFKKATEILNVPDDWVQSFIDGFDDNGIAKIATYPEAWTIGHEIRKEVQPIAMRHYILKLEQEEDENG